LIKSSNQMCDGRLDGRTDRHVHPSISTLLKATRVFYFFYYPGSLLWPEKSTDNVTTKEKNRKRQTNDNLQHTTQKANDWDQ
jgi:hypothetical protein